jgi:outer membrane immunogenic protein
VVDRDVAVKASSGVLLTAAAAAAGSAPALAQDPVALLPPPEPVSSWQGIYLGASVGASWLQSVQDDLGAVPGVTLANAAAVMTGGSSSTVNGVGWLGGLNLGYNFQSGNFVYGLEADISWLGRTSASSNGAFASNYLSVAHGYIIPTNGTTFRSSQINGLGTFRARFGFDFNGTLPYVTLGVAGADIKNTFGINATNTFNGLANSASVSQTKWVPGIVLGSGIEHRLNQNWSLRGEVDWIGFETRSLNNPLFSATYLAPTSNHGPVTFSNDLVIVRVGLNYRY